MPHARVTGIVIAMRHQEIITYGAIIALTLLVGFLLLRERVAEENRRIDAGIRFACALEHGAKDQAALRDAIGRKVFEGITVDELFAIQRQLWDDRPDPMELFDQARREAGN